MAKLHTHYITNAKNELKYSFLGLSEDTFHSTIQEAINRARSSDDFDDEEHDEEYDEEYDDEECDSDIEEEDDTSRNIAVENWINLDDPELKRILDVEVNVMIEPRPLIIDHGSNIFNMEDVVNRALGN